jgi:hypothetical protein
MEFSAQQAYDFGMLPLVAWREAQDQGYAGMFAVCCVARNRVNNPSIYGWDYPSVIMKKWQFSSFNWNDPNSQKEPHTDTDAAFGVALQAAVDCYTGADDTTGGATVYYDRSLDPDSRPDWATDGSHTATCDIGDFHFFKVLPGHGPV